ncbi:MAG: CoA transferase [Chloroflexi bacterium]|nr:CoA transferase [Chloroflexota bacterium]
MAGIADGLKVVAMEQWVVAPMATVLLADWGADIIRVEPLTGDAMRALRRMGGATAWIKLGDVQVNPSEQFMHRGKRSIALDLKKEPGRNILCQLVEKADVFISNYQPNALEKLRLDYNTLSKINPRLVYAVITGYGSQGPDKDERAFDDAAFWAHSGFAHLVTVPGCPPPRQPGGLGDRTSSVYAVAGIMAALFHREKTGKGQEIDLSLYRSALWCISGNMSGALTGAPPRVESRTKSQNPLQNTYHTKDDRWFQLMMPQSDLFWADFCQAIDKPELQNDPRFNNYETRTHNCEELIRMLDQIFILKTIEQWEELFKKHHLIYSRLQTLDEVIADPQSLANNFFTEVPHPAGRIRVLASPIEFRQNPASVKGPAPEVGQHTEEILLDLGYNWENIGQLKEQGVIL